MNKKNIIVAKIGGAGIATIAMFNNFISNSRFIYTDSATLINLEHACGVLYAANKYFLPELTKQCINYISVNIVPESACAILELVRSLGVTELVIPCIKVRTK